MTEKQCLVKKKCVKKHKKILLLKLSYVSPSLFPSATTYLHIHMHPTLFARLLKIDILFREVEQKLTIHVCVCVCLYAVLYKRVKKGSF